MLSQGIFWLQRLILVCLHLKYDGGLEDFNGMPSACGDGDADGGSTRGKANTMSLMALVIVKKLVELSLEDDNRLT